MYEYKLIDKMANTAGSASDNAVMQMLTGGFTICDTSGNVLMTPEDLMAILHGEKTIRLIENADPAELNPAILGCPYKLIRAGVEKGAPADGEATAGLLEGWTVYNNTGSRKLVSPDEIIEVLHGRATVEPVEG